MDLHGLLALIATNRLGLIVFQITHIDVALGHLTNQHISDLTQFKVIIAIQNEGFIFLLDSAIRTFEVKAIGDFFIGLLNGIFKFNHIGFTNHIK